MNATALSFVFVALIIGAVIGWLFASRESAGVKQTVQSLRAQLDEAVRERDANREAATKLAALEATQLEREKGFEARIQELVEAKEALSAQFAEISNKLLVEAQETFLKRADQRFRQSEEHVLERVEHGRLARPGQTRDEQQSGEGTAVRHGSELQSEQVETERNLGRCRSGHRIDADKRYPHSKDQALAAVVRQAPDLAGEFDNQRDWHIRDRFHLDDPDPADFELAGDICRSRRYERRTVARHDCLVIADQRETPVQQAERKVGFPRA